MKTTAASYLSQLEEWPSRPLPENPTAIQEALYVYVVEDLFVEVLLIPVYSFDEPPTQHISIEDIGDCPRFTKKDWEMARGTPVQLEISFIYNSRV